MIAVETPGFGSLLDFWRLSPRSSLDVSLVASSALESGRRNALVCTMPAEPPDLYAWGDDCWIFARVARVEEVPDGHESLETIRDRHGDIYSHVLRDPASNVITVPFVFDDAVEGLALERYAQALGSAVPPAALKAYYALKRFVPRAAIREARSFVARRSDDHSRFPAWPFEASLESLRLLFVRLLLEVTGDDGLEFVWFWPDGRDYCLLVTHDVDTSSGRDNIGAFLDLEADLGLRSAYNLVPADYAIPDGLLATIAGAGCEVGVHGWTHDGLLFSDWPLFTDRVERMREVAARWGAVGFRSPATHRNPDWFYAMGFDYDSSAPDTDPFEPQSGGCLSLFPFMVGDVLEIPITMPQDHTLMALLKDRDGLLWRRKAHEIVSRHGVVCMLAHPDGMPGYAGNEKVRPVYRSFLEELTTSCDGYWNPVPRELSAWWRRRVRATVSPEGSVVSGGTLVPEARMGLVRLRGDAVDVVPPAQYGEGVRACAG
jgi:hypothetical protein